MLLKTDNHTTEQDPQKYLDFLKKFEAKKLRTTATHPPPFETAQQRREEELNPTIVWQLSPREEKIIEYLNAKTPRV